MRRPEWLHRPAWLHAPRWPRPQKRERAEMRTPTGARRGDWLVRWCAMLAVVAVAGVAGYISYWHAVTVVTQHGETAVRGHLYPVVIDGIIVAASMVVLDAARHRERAPLLSWSLLGAGIAVTLAANITYGVAFGLAGALWAAWPALGFVGCFELLMMLVRASARRAENLVPREFPSAIPSDVEAAALASMRATVAAGNPWSVNALVTKFGVSRQVATNIRSLVLAEANGHAPETEE